MMIEIELSDLQKIRDVLKKAHEHHDFRDRMNATLHLASEVRFSPLTSELASALGRLVNIEQEATEEKCEESS